MLRTFLTALVLIPTVAFAANKQAEKQVSIDTQASKVNWKGSKLFVSDAHHGTVSLSGGNLTMSGDKITGGEFTIDMTSIKDEDLTDAGYNKKLVGHLNSPDFFDTAQFKDAKYVITKATASKNGEYTFDGNLTIHGVTQPQQMKAIVKKEGGAWVATGQLSFDRTKFNVKYSSQTAFPDLVKKGKDKIIGDQIDIDYTIKTAAM